jgi:hypothetical protein
MDEKGKCDNETEPPEPGYIPNLNQNKMCGFTDDGWKLPSEAQLNTMEAYVSGVPKEAQGAWFNSHGFRGIQSNVFYWGECTEEKCLIPPGADGEPWLTKYGTDGFYGYSDFHTYGWGVHSKPSVTGALNSDNNLNDVIIGGVKVSFNNHNESIVELPFDTKFLLNLNVKFTTNGTKVALLSGEVFTIF